MSVATAAPRHLVVRAFGERLALRLPARALAITGILLLALLVTVSLSLLTGTYGISLDEMMETLRGITVSAAIDNVVWEFRFPRILVAALAGAMTAISGLVLQNLTRNGLADPSLVGISQGAALAVVLLTVALPDRGVVDARPVAAFAGSIAVAVIIQWLSRSRTGTSPIRFILMGIGVSAFIASITSALLTYGEIDRAMSALAWLAGSINAASWGDATLLAIGAIILVAPVFGLSRAMNIMRLGEPAAIGLGTRVRPVRLVLIACAVGLAAIPTSVVGPLGFVGLIAPHAASRLSRSGPALHVILTALSGALLVTLADLAGRTIFAPIQIPAGLLTALIGVPLFIWLLGHARGAPQT